VFEPGGISLQNDSKASTIWWAKVLGRGKESVVLGGKSQEEEAGDSEPIATDVKVLKMAGKLKRSNNR
jgi:UDP-N-acetylglucosamine pyrophosphorylase